MRTVRVPGDKSVTHRALLLSAIAPGTHRVRNALTGEDPQATARVLRALGCPIPALPADGSELVIESRGATALRTPADVLDCANSGTTARLLLGVLAGVPVRATMTGDASLRGRPMRRVTVPLARMGARFQPESPEHLPLTIAGGALQPTEHASEHASAQVKSALLLAGVTGGVRVVVTEPMLSRDHTERMLRALGAALRTDRDGERATVTLTDASRLGTLDVSVPGDFSSAAFFIALGLLGNEPVRVEGVGLNPTRSGLLGVLARMGARIDIENVRTEGGEETGDVVAHPSSLRGTSVDAAEIPSMIDEVPVLAVLAARAEGETRVTGARELRVKESDRLAVLAANLRALDATADELPDGLVVHGSDAPLRGHVPTHGDHRIAMAFGVLGALPGCDVTVDDPGAADVSFPEFWRLLHGAGAA